MNWILERWQALLFVVACYGLGLIVWLLSGKLFALADPNYAAILSTASPAGVTGTDLVANLLTISALTVSACIAYLCLPSDRVEIRISTYVKVALLRELIEEDDFHEFFDKLVAEEVTPACRAVRGLLSPRSGIGGWHRMGEGELAETFGSKEWRQLRRFVDHHGDEKEMLVLVIGLALAMGGAIVCLGARYLGLWTTHYNGFEAAMIVVLLALNVGIPAMGVRLAMGGRTGERSARERIDGYVKELSPRVKQHQAKRRDENLSELSAQAKQVSGTAAPSSKIALVPGTTTRKATRTRSPR